MIVVLGGSTVDSITWEPLAEDARPGAPNVTVVRMQLNSFDLNGFAALHRHRGHPRVRADTYVYLHDTCRVHERLFVPTFEAYRLPPAPLVYTPWPLPASNLLAFGRPIVGKYADNFDIPVSKGDGMALEIGLQVRRPGHRLVKPIVAFGAVVKLRPREHNGSVDIYGTGRLRWQVFYAAFGARSAVCGA